MLSVNIHPQPSRNVTYQDDKGYFWTLLEFCVLHHHCFSDILMLVDSF